MNTDREYDFGFDATQCQNCGGRCCTGESGYVFMNINEMLEIAQLLHLEFETFTQTYVRKVGYRFSLIEKNDEGGLACVFFDTFNKQCQIYDKRPKQCRDFPFWEAHKSSILNSHHLLALQKECQGIQILSHILPKESQK